MKFINYHIFILVFAGTIPLCSLHARQVSQIITYPSTVSSGPRGPLQLTAEITYETERQCAPIVALIHGFSPLEGNFHSMHPLAHHLEDKGFFVITPAMRERDGSDGKRDCGGLEVYDVYDAIEFVKKSFEGAVDPDNIHIVGYSGGGAVALLAAVRFPDYFRVVSSFYGMSDYGYDTSSGWFFKGAKPGHRRILCESVGSPAKNNPLVRDRYLARCAWFGARNNRSSEIHLFVNSDEECCPVSHNYTFIKKARGKAESPGLFKNIVMHLGNKGVYADFNNNGKNDPFEEQYWPHLDPSVRGQKAGESWYIERLISGKIPQPTIPGSGSFMVPGYIKTNKFSVWLGDGQNAAGKVFYSLSKKEKGFKFGIVTSDTLVPIRLSVDCSDMERPLRVSLDGKVIRSAYTASVFECDSLRDGSFLKISSIRKTTRKGQRKRAG